MELKAIKIPQKEDFIKYVKQEILGILASRKFEEYVSFWFSYIGSIELKLSVDCSRKESFEYLFGIEEIEYIYIEAKLKSGNKDIYEEEFYINTTDNKKLTDELIRIYDIIIPKINESYKKYIIETYFEEQ